MKLIVLSLMILFFSFPLISQEEPDISDNAEESRIPELFPLALLLSEVENSGNRLPLWQPDWPRYIPPDAFNIIPGSGVRKIILEGNELSLNYELDQAGNIVSFPYLIDGKMVQVQLIYQNNFQAGNISQMHISFFEEGYDTWVFEFLEYRDLYPYLIRVQSGAYWFFIGLNFTSNEIIETWYNIEGYPVEVYRYYLSTVGNNNRIRTVLDYSNTRGRWDYHYDSRGLITVISNQDFDISFLYYRDYLPRYGEIIRTVYAPYYPGGSGNLSYQWDGRDLLTRVSGDDLAGFGYDYIEYRYEYTFDYRGNWIERRELLMVPIDDLLFPFPGTVFRRILEYEAD